MINQQYDKCIDVHDIKAYEEYLRSSNVQMQGSQESRKPGKPGTVK